MTLRDGERRPARNWAFAVSPVVAVLYATLGLITLSLSRMVGLSSPVWPAAGLALAAALRWRWRVLPGIFAGSLATEVLWLIPQGEPAPRAWLTGIAVGAGATLGAGVGAALVNRFVGPIQQLDTPRAVILSLALGGLLATTIAPTFGVAVQLGTGLLSTGQAALGWLTWWVGDSIGAVAVAPVVLMLLPARTRYWSGRRWTIAVPSLLIVGILMAAVMQNVARERARVDGAVAHLADRAAADLAVNIARHQEVLEGLKGFIDASQNVTETEFRTYTGDVLARLPNLQALSWNPLVTESDLAAFQAAQRTRPGLAGFTVTQRDTAGTLLPVSPRPDYVVVTYIEPIDKNRNALGYDILSNPIRAAAIETARDTGRPTATAPIDLVQESGTQKGMLALAPIYAGGSDPGSTAARRAGLRGFAVAVYRSSDLLAETFRGPDWDSVEITLTDVSNRSAPIAIADLPPRNAGSRDPSTATTSANTAPLDVYGRTWELTVHPTSAAFDDRRGAPVLVLLAALALTFLLESFLFVLSGMDSLARRLVSELGSAARYVTSILPNDVDSPLPISSRYVPSQELGGDSFDHRWIDDDHLIAYLVDVSGHGIAPAMFSVSVHNLLRSGTLDDDTLRDPGLVLTELNRLFQMDQQAGHFFTIWYGVYQVSTRTLRYAGAGHPPAIVLSEDGSDPVVLPSESIPIGLLAETAFDTHSYPLATDARDLLIYSDGAFELNLRDGRGWSLGGFIDLCAHTAATPGWSLDDLVAGLRDRSASTVFDDDCTLVRVTFRPLGVPEPAAVPDGEVADDGELSGLQ